MQIRAVALDMDGTLLSSDNKIAEAGVNVLKKLRDRGIYIFLATGRTRTEIYDVLPDHFPVDGFVTSNGAGCYTDEQTLVEVSIDFEQVQKVITLARDHGMYYEVHPFEGERIAYRKDKHIFENVFYGDGDFTAPDHWVNLFREAFEANVHWVNRLPDVPIVKVLFFHRERTEVETFRQKLIQIKDDGGFMVSSSVDHNVEIVHKDATKGSGLCHFLEKFGISPEELVVFGDGENDLPMFHLAKHAVAMKNAPTFVKQAADDVTDDTNDQLGVFRYIDKHEEIFIRNKNIF